MPPNGDSHDNSDGDPEPTDREIDASTGWTDTQLSSIPPRSIDSNEPTSRRRRRLLAGIGTGALFAGVGITPATAQEGVHLTLDNVGASAWEVTSTDTEEVARTGVQNPTLSLQIGERYVIRNDGQPGHPLAFRDADGDPLLSQPADGRFEDDPDVDWADDGNEVAFTLTESLAEEIHDYVCTIHPSMVGDVAVDVDDDGGDAAVSFSDQDSLGDTVVIEEVRMDDGGFVTMHDSTLLDGEVIPSVVGVSEYLEPGTHEDIEVQFDRLLVEDDTLIAMPHRDTTDTEEFEFAATDGDEDGPYLRGDGEALTDAGEVSIVGDAAALFSDTRTDGETVIVDEVRVDDGGFLAMHDSTLLDGEVLGSSIGVSEYLEPGTHEEVEVTFLEPLADDDLLIAMPHRDTTGTKEFEFLETDGAEDGAYLTPDGEAVMNSANVRVGAAAAVTFSDQDSTGEFVTVDEVRVDDGGFLAMHDSTLLDGEVLDSSIGVSEYLEPGTHEEVRADLLAPLEETDTLIAMPHRDTTGTEEFEFLETDGEEDGAYLTLDGEAVTDPAEVTPINYDSPDGEVRFASPENGATVESPVELAFEADGFTVESAEEGLNDGAGHMHVLIDRPFYDPGEEIPSTEDSIHYGGGEMEVELELDSGEYTLRLQPGDALHNAYDLGDTIEIEVADEGSADETTDETPGFGVIAALSGIGGVTAYAYRRLAGDEAND